MSPNEYIQNATCISVDQFVCHQAESCLSAAVQNFSDLNKKFHEEFFQFENLLIYSYVTFEYFRGEHMQNDSIFLNVCSVLKWLVFAC
jgi:hypothetical protein